MSSKESNVTGVIFDLFFNQDQTCSGGKVGVGSGWEMGVSKRVKCDLRIPPIRKVRHVSSKESNVTGVIFDLFHDHMAGDLIIFP